MTHPTRTDYVLTLADGRTVDITIEPRGNASWYSEVPSGQVDSATYSASRGSFEGFGEAMAAACRHVDRWSGSYVVRVEPKERSR